MAEDKKIEQLTALTNLTTANASRVFAAVSMDSTDLKLAMSVVKNYVSSALNINSLYNELSFSYNPETKVVIVSVVGGGGLISYKINGVDYSISAPATITLPTPSYANSVFVIGLSATGLVYYEINYVAKIEGYDYIPIAIIMSNGTALWEENGNYTELINPQIVRYSKAIQENQAAALASAPYLNLSGNGNYAAMADNDNAIQLISKFDSAGNSWQGGTLYRLYVLAGQKIEHNRPDYDEYVGILIDSQQDWTANSDTLIFLTYDSTLEKWILAGTSTGDILINATNIIAKPVNMNVYSLASGGAISGFESDSLVDCTVSNLGTATVSIGSNNSYIVVGAGIIYGIDVLDSVGVLKHRFICCENAVDEPYLFDVVTGQAFYIIGTKSVVTQDVYCGIGLYGFSYKQNDDTGNYIAVPYTINGEKI